MDFFVALPLKQIYGAPIGTIGSGTIGRSFNGDFVRYHLVPGLYEHQTVDANMFTVSIRKKERCCYQQALVCRDTTLNGLKTWNMNYCKEFGSYHVLYPQAWYTYELPGQNVKLTCHQISPMIPKNYKDSSLPVGMFNWTIDNNNDEEIEVSLMFTWQSGSASDKFEISNVSSSSFEMKGGVDSMIKGVVINQKIRNMPLEYCVSAEKTVK
jgi:non-lysosomal glucosylceramidase